MNPEVTAKTNRSALFPHSSSLCTSITYQWLNFLLMVAFCSKLHVLFSFYLIPFHMPRTESERKTGKLTLVIFDFPSLPAHIYLCCRVFSFLGFLRELQHKSGLGKVPYKNILSIHTEKRKGKKTFAGDK